jgi:hypothetical protein
MSCGLVLRNNLNMAPLIYSLIYQYARSSNGKSWLWLWIGRSKIAWRGEAKSDLRFDVAVKAATVR